MIILDHNIPKDQAEKLGHRRIHFRQIGFEVGQSEWEDQQQDSTVLDKGRMKTIPWSLARRQIHRHVCRAK